MLLTLALKRCVPRTIITVGQEYRGEEGGGNDSGCIKPFAAFACPVATVGFGSTPGGCLQSKNNQQKDQWSRTGPESRVSLTLLL